MPDTVTAPGWLPIDLLKHRYAANVAALASRSPELAVTLGHHIASRRYFIRTEVQRVILGFQQGDSVQPLPVVLSPGSAQATVTAMFPSGKCSEPVLIIGEDLGWLWNNLYELPCQVMAAPGHRPPLFFLTDDLERLWLMLHLQDWQRLLADPRARLFTGADCIDQFRRSLIGEPTIPWPKLSVDITPAVWPAGITLNGLLTAARAVQNVELNRLEMQLQTTSAAKTPEAIAERFAFGQPLKVLGITSRYTTFIQHSMRDWLAAFEQLGHTVRLEIEADDHHIPNNLSLAAKCVDFNPDLIVAIDHYRSSLSGIASGTPVVMWVQDALPTLFSKQAGAEQGPIDFALGIASLKMVHEFGYPADRYQSALIGVNEKRFNLTVKPAKFACDVSFVSHASTSAQAMLQEKLKLQNSPHATALITEIFNQLQRIYATGGMVTEPVIFHRLIEQARVETKTTVRSDQIPILVDQFLAPINNLFFRHQSLQWLADAGVNLHLYGNGWESHPTLARFARGPADNQNQLASIYASSKINLHASPYGAIHQRILEGLSCGGFFMLRYCPGDIMERYFKPILDFCQARGITTDADLRQQADATIQAHLDKIADTLQRSPFEEPWTFMDALRSSDRNGYIRSAGTIWGDDYDAVSFNSAVELTAKVSHFLQNDDERQQRMESMRQTVLHRFTYSKITRRMLDFVTAGLQRHAAHQSKILAAAA